MGFTWASLVGRRARRSSSPPQLSGCQGQLLSQDANEPPRSPGMQSRGEAEVLAWLNGKDSSAALARVIDKQERAPKKLIRKLAPATQGADEVREWMSSSSPRALENVLRVRDKFSLDTQRYSDLSLLLQDSSKVAPRAASLDDDDDWSVGIDTPEGENPLPVSPMDPKYVSLTREPASSESSGSCTPPEQENETPTRGRTRERQTPFLNLYREHTVGHAETSLRGTLDTEEGIILPLAAATVEQANEIQLSSSQTNPLASFDSSASITDATPGTHHVENQPHSLLQMEDEGHILPVVVGQPMRAQTVEVVNSEDELVPPQGNEANKPKGSAEYEVLETGEVISVWSSDSSSDEDGESESYDANDKFKFSLTPPSPTDSEMATGCAELQFLEISSSRNPEGAPATPLRQGFELARSSENNDCEEQEAMTDEWLKEYDAQLQRQFGHVQTVCYQSPTIDPPIPDHPNKKQKKPKDRPPPLKLGDDRPRKYGQFLDVPLIGYNSESDREGRPQRSHSSSSDVVSSGIVHAPDPPRSEYPDMAKFPLDFPEAERYLFTIRKYLSLPPSTNPSEIQQILSRNPEIIRHSLLGRVSNPHLAQASRNDDYPREIEASVGSLHAYCDFIEALYSLAWDPNERTGGELTHILNLCDEVMSASHRSGTVRELDILQKVFIKELKRRGDATFTQRTELLKHLDFEDIDKLEDECRLVKGGMMDQFVQLVQMGVFISEDESWKGERVLAQMLDVPLPLNNQEKLAQMRYNRLHPTPSPLREVWTAVEVEQEVPESKGPGKEPAA